MTSLLRREPRHLDFPEWMTRWMEERGLGESLLPAAFGSGIRVEEVSEEGTHVIRAELPGIDPDKDVEISIHGGMLHLQASRTERQEDRDNDTYRSEFRYGRFERALPLPAGTTEKDVTTTYRDGVLEVRLPVETAAHEAAKIAVKRA
jgi:HSP20 family protein